MDTHPQPTRDRPRFPEGYGIPEAEDGLLAWPEVYERLAQSQNYWVVTASLDGRPHTAPVWGAWVDGRFYFEGSPMTRWGRNIVANPRIEVHLESGAAVTIVEGTVEDVDTPAPDLAERVCDAFAAKYNGYRTQGLGFFILIPRRALAWTSFPQDVTRFRFRW